MTNCRSVHRYVCENLDENINSARCRAIRKHLQTCPDCTAYLDSIKKTVLLYRTMSKSGPSASSHRVLLRSIDQIWKRTGREAKPHLHSRKPAR